MLQLLVTGLAPLLLQFAHRIETLLNSLDQDIELPVRVPRSFFNSLSTALIAAFLFSSDTDLGWAFCWCGFLGRSFLSHFFKPCHVPTMNSEPYPR